jgi:hypothetical protein
MFLFILLHSMSAFNNDQPLTAKKHIIYKLSELAWHKKTIPVFPLATAGDGETGILA